MGSEEYKDEQYQQVTVYQNILENLQEGYVLIKEDGQIKDANVAFCEIMDYKKAALLKMNFRNIHPEFSDRFNSDAVKEIFREGPQIFEIKYHSKAGQSVHLEIQAIPVEANGNHYIANLVKDVTENVNVKRKLTKAKNRFEALFEHNPHPVYYLDLEGNFKGANSKMEEISGYNLKELKQFNFVPLVSEDQVQESLQIFEEVKKGKIKTHEFEGITKRGKKIPIRSTSFPMIVEDEIVGVFGIAEDISEQKEAEQKLCKNNQKWKQLLQHLPLPVQVTRDSKILFLNKAGAEMYAVDSADNIKGVSVFEFNPPKVIEKIKERVRKMNTGINVEHSHEHKIFDKKGAEHIVEVFSIPIQYEEQQAILSTFNDITSRKQAEQKSREHENLKSAIFQTALDAIVIFDHKGDIVEFNKAAEKMFGYDNQEVEGKKIADVIVPPKYREAHQKGMNRYIDTRDERILGKRLKIEAMRADGSIFPVEVSIDKIIGTEPSQFTGYIRDITDQERKKKQILDSLREKEIMLQEIHHRVKNNMAVISGLLELQSMSTENSNLQQILYESQLRIHSMAMIHEKLYASESLSQITFDDYIKELSQTIISTTTGLHSKVDVKFHLDNVQLNVNQAIPCGLILNELVVNCFKHAFDNQKTGSVLIGLIQEEEQIELFVEDNGKGFPEDFAIEQQETLGMQLIQALTAQLDGKLNIAHHEDNLGSCCKVSFIKN